MCLSCLGMRELLLLLQGIYRVSAVKSVVDAVCRKVESLDTDVVDLSSYSPHVVTGVLKRILRQASVTTLPCGLVVEWLACWT